MLLQIQFNFFLHKLFAFVLKWIILDFTEDTDRLIIGLILSMP